MTTLVNKLSRPRTRQFVEPIALAASLAFLGADPAAGIDRARRARVRWSSTPTLDMSMSWRARAMPVGIGLMIALRSCCASLAQPRRAMLLALMRWSLRSSCGSLLLHADAARRSAAVNLVVFFLGVVPLTVFAGIPIAVLVRPGDARLSGARDARADRGAGGAASKPACRTPMLLSVPLFVFLGLLIEMTGMAQVMVRFLANLLGHVRGGLHYVLIAAMYLVSGISGSKAADMAAVAPVLFPEMEKRGASAAIWWRCWRRPARRPRRSRPA